MEKNTGMSHTAAKNIKIKDRVIQLEASFVDRVITFSILEADTGILVFEPLLVLGENIEDVTWLFHEGYEALFRDIVLELVYFVDEQETDLAVAREFIIAINELTYELYKTQLVPTSFGWNKLQRSVLSF